ncbi:UNVERIFIED_CONTAM: hypothetical protein Sindi_1627100 [Sesamum indicum]
MTVSDYYGKLKKLWNELVCITRTPNCTCGAAKEASEIRGNDNLMQFLMGLNESYDHNRSQILIMEPLPDSNKAYAMVLRVEKQKQVNSGQLYTAPNMAMHAFKKTEPAKNSQRRKNFVDKKAQVCKHCGKNGHLKEGCFDIIGYPDWYKPFLEQKKEGAQNLNRAATARTEIERANNTVDERTVSELVRTEFQKLMDGLKSQKYTTENNDFSGKHLEHNVDECAYSNTWIIDSGATTHMCNDKSMINESKAPNDLKTEDIIAITSIIGKLYIPSPEFFDRRYIEETMNKVCDIGLAASILQPETWHRRLGHLSYDVLVKIGLVNRNKRLNSTCDICPQAKQQRMPFNISTSHSNACFDLVHMDLWGPYNEPSIFNCS